MEGAIRTGLAQLGLDPHRAAPLARYGHLLLEKNRVMNLTAITDPLQVATLHMLDCAALAAHWDLTGSLIDVGTGAGFPGLVLAVLRPHLQVTLLDPLEKRLNFIQEVIDDLGLENVTLLHARGEEAGRDPALRETFTFATARAVAELQVLAELALPLVEVGGVFLAMKAVDSHREAAEAAPLIAALGGRLDPPWDYPLPHLTLTHRVYPLVKTAPTPPTYPRRWSKIARGKGGAPG